MKIGRTVPPHGGNGTRTWWDPYYENSPQRWSDH